MQNTLNDFEPAEAQDPFIKAFVEQYKQKSFELDCYKKVQKGMFELERLKVILTQDKELNSSLED